MSARWVNLRTASALVGTDIALLSKRSRAGHYGPLRHARFGEVLVSSHGLELACRVVLTDPQIDAAIAGRPLPPGPYDPDFTFRNLSLPRRRLSIDEIGARVIRTRHKED